MSKPTITLLPFQKLHKRYNVKVWWAKLQLGFFFLLLPFILLVLGTGIGLHAAFPDEKTDTFGFGGLMSNILAGFIGAAIVAVVSYLHHNAHANLHYSEELRKEINKAQNRYQISSSEAGELLIYNDPFLLTIDNFFRYIGTTEETEMLPKIQKFGSIVLPEANTYLRITLYWQTMKGFFVTEENLKYLTELH